jgi:ABC-2 type transport system permease protein
MGLLIGVFAKTDEHVTLYSMIAMFIFSALGGAWFSLETAGTAFSTVGKILPSAWAITGLQNILIRGLDLSSVLVPVSYLLLYTVAFLLVAVWRFRSIEI